MYIARTGHRWSTIVGRYVITVLSPPGARELPRGSMGSEGPARHVTMLPGHQHLSAMILASKCRSEDKATSHSIGRSFLDPGGRHDVYIRMCVCIIVHTPSYTHTIVTRCLYNLLQR